MSTRLQKELENNERTIIRLFNAIPEYLTDEAGVGRNATKIYQVMQKPKKEIPEIKSFCKFESAIDNLIPNIRYTKGENKKINPNPEKWKWSSTTYCHSEKFHKLKKFKETMSNLHNLHRYREEMSELKLAYHVWNRKKIIIYGKITAIKNNKVTLSQCQTHFSADEKFEFFMSISNEETSVYEKELGKFVVLFCDNISKNNKMKEFHNDVKILYNSELLKIENEF